jgi:hypothetical protein
MPWEPERDRFGCESNSAGFDGLAIGFHNPLDELPYFAQEVLPRMERLGLR